VLRYDNDCDGEVVEVASCSHWGAMITVGGDVLTIQVLFGKVEGENRGIDPDELIDPRKYNPSDDNDDDSRPHICLTALLVLWQP